MVFSSYEFILMFLPLVLIATFVARRFGGQRATMLILTAASWFFYAWWDLRFLPLLLLSTVGNFLIAEMLTRRPNDRRIWLITGIACNLGLLGYFKYWNFFIANVEAVMAVDFNFAHIILPIGISFFTFQQIAFLVDTSRLGYQRYGLLEYSLFVSFFPQLIAGPIVHHAQLIPQFRHPDMGRFQLDRLSAGIIVFVAGFSKKVLIADTLGTYVDPLYAAAARGVELSMLEAWGAATTYGLQLYFDFSGYADMAIGIGLMLGITLPANFDRPYASTSVREFWRRWHMTLSQFLRDYVYIPLGGGRCGRLRQCTNIMITMMLGGLWHGASWVFLLWGALHGTYMVCERAMDELRKRGCLPQQDSIILRNIAWALVLLAVFVAWVPFRAADIGTTFLLWKSMVSGTLLPGLFATYLPDTIVNGLSNIGLSIEGENILRTSQWALGVPMIVACFVLAVILPNGIRIAELVQPAVQRGRIAVVFGSMTSIVFVASLIMLSYNPVFLYFQF